MVDALEDRLFKMGCSRGQLMGPQFAGIAEKNHIGKGAADIGPNAKGGFFHHHAHMLSIGRLAARMVGYKGSISRQVSDGVTYCRASISSAIESVYLHFYSCSGWGKGVQ